ncbi:MAG: NAD(P)H-dependent glycerol-3-phosphate dehydrogenase, partial [Pseudomonadota bacterium]|nr:NAD(P)H-dependent glycerol-3-phosphate dehydrogenase [Pseudomonadota bacterium]
MTGALVIGGGSWGTALAHALRCGTATPRILARDPEAAALLADGRCRQLADLPAVASFDATTDPSAISEAELVFLVVPAAATAELLRRVDTLAAPGTPVVVCAKGLVMEDGHPRFMTELAADLCPRRPVVIMSGPTFADEVLQGLPAAITAAGRDEAAVTSVQTAFSGSHLRVYAGRDPLGLAIGGAMKNVTAIAAGCASGLGLGDNAKAALITRGLAEMARFATAASAAPDTVYGLSGAGDLALTCAGPHSRNMAYGLAPGRGEAPSQ